MKTIQAKELEFMHLCDVSTLRCVLALAAFWDLWLITSDVYTVFMHDEVEKDACALVLSSNISYKGERVVCLLFKATNGLRRRVQPQP